MEINAPFYVKDVNKYLVPAKFLVGVDGNYIVNPNRRPNTISQWNEHYYNADGTEIANANPNNYLEGLSRLLLCNQRLVGSGGDLHGVLEQGCKAGEAVFPAVEAEHELVEIGLHVLFAQAVIDAERPAFEV